ncbi:hypothetical protein N7499_013083 [Penicillium canescens]|nr:hypothetical protein N7499_013083 [Penicillium canescens]KAJ6154098.1 hypothetical protein N7485_012467 [Penicillium canescens]
MTSNSYTPPDKDDCIKELKSSKIALHKLADSRKTISKVLEQISLVKQCLRNYHDLIIYIRLYPKPKRPGVPIIIIPFFAASLALFDRLWRRVAALHFLPPYAKALLNVGLSTK